MLPNEQATGWEDGGSLAGCDALQVIQLLQCYNQRDIGDQALKCVGQQRCEKEQMKLCWSV